MTTKIGIIGLGHVGSAIAQQMIVSGLADEYVLISHNENKIHASKLDFEDAIVNLDNYAKIYINDYSKLAEADILISTVGNVSATQKSGNRDGELKVTSGIVKSIAKNINESGFNGVLIVVSNPLDVITTLFQNILKLPNNKIIGTGTLLDTARLKRILGSYLNIDPKSIDGYVLGEHGNKQVIAWSTVKAMGKSILQLDHKYNLDLNKIEKDIISGGLQIAKYRGFTDYGVAAAAVRLSKVVLSNSHEELVVSHRDERENISYSFPAIVGNEGIIKDIKITLNNEEQEKLDQSMNAIKNSMKLE